MNLLGFGPRSVWGGRSDVGADELRAARVAAARACSPWTEVADDFVERQGGHVLVSAATDEMFRRYRGPVFETAGARIIPDRSPLFFTVDADEGLRFYERQTDTWSDVVARQARRGRRA